LSGATRPEPIRSMNEKAFQELLQSGLGRAIIYARGHDMISGGYDLRPFPHVVLDACRRCYSLDVQSEGPPGAFALHARTRIVGQALSPANRAPKDP
jgi:hypothetical protein